MIILKIREVVNTKSSLLFFTEEFFYQKFYYLLNGESVFSLKELDECKPFKLKLSLLPLFLLLHKSFIKLRKQSRTNMKESNKKFGYKRVDVIGIVFEDVEP